MEKVDGGMINILVYKTCIKKLLILFKN